MIRTAEWKYTRRFPDGPDELYDLTNDPGERSNLIDRPGYASTVQALRARLDEFFNRYADPKYDRWKGGTSKSHLITGPKPKKAATAKK